MVKLIYGRKLKSLHDEKGGSKLKEGKKTRRKEGEKGRRQQNRVDSANVDGPAH